LDGASLFFRLPFGGSCREVNKGEISEGFGKSVGVGVKISFPTSRVILG
jgi:hypothetical protein